MTVDPKEVRTEGAASYARRESLDDSRWYVGGLFTVLASSEETGGRFGLLEILSPKGAEPPRHIHHNEDETFYVMEGEVTFYIGDDVYEATPGTFVYGPRGVPHSFVFETDVVRMHTIVAPGGAEEHFRDERYSEPAEALTLPPEAGPPDVAALAEDLARYGIEIVGPPGPPHRG